MLKKNIITFFFLLFTFYSCSIPGLRNGDIVYDDNSEDKTCEIITENSDYQNVKIEERLWNILIYMPADNNLENSALSDIYEMEISRLNTDLISIFILIDRSSAYDASEKNWCGTRLYRLKTGRKNETKQMISEEISCIDLGLEVGKETELDMSSEYVLTNCLCYLRKKFPANNYGLIIWGHGTGWRNDFCSNECNLQITKGFAFDESNKTYMTLTQLGNGIKNSLSEKKLAFIGFDTCFGGEIEVFLELMDCADYLIGSAGLVMSSGWNYTMIFNKISDENIIEPIDICECIVNEYEKEYLNTNGASIAAIKTEFFDSFFEAFDEYMLLIANLISCKKNRDDIMGILFANKDCATQYYTYGTENSDVYLDIMSLVENCYLYFEEDNEDLLSPAKEIIETEKNKSIVKSWGFNNENNQGNIGVFFSTLTSGNLVSSILPAAYSKEKTIEQIFFVRRSKGYVPTKNENISFLDKLFYTKYE